MTADQFRLALREMEISQNLFATITGTNPRTVIRWAHEQQDIPRWVSMMIALLRSHPETARSRYVGDEKNQTRLLTFATKAGVFHE